MRKILYVLGLISLVLVVLLVCSIGFLAYRGNALDSESKSFVDAAVPAIAANWDEKALLDRASPELIQATGPYQLRAAFARFSRLGRLMTYQGASGQADILSGAGSSVSAVYTANGHFENGDAVFRIGLVKQDDRWLIRRLNITPLRPIIRAPAHA